MAHSTFRTLNRREFIATVTASAAAIAVPAIATAAKTDTRTVIGSGEHRYEVIHNWPQLPDKFTWQTTHDVATDDDGFLYVIHEGLPEKTGHPAIFVFDPEGKYVRSFGQQFQGGGHGLEVRKEGGEHFLYVCGYQPKVFAKLSTRGGVVWQHTAPMASKLYATGEDTGSLKRGGRDNFMPTNFALLPDGGFLLADGYGSFYIHRFDANANWLSCFGGPGDEDGKFNTPHGIWIDDRPGHPPEIVVTDRSHGKLQWFSLDGKHLRTQADFIFPANIDCRGDVMLVPDMASRITLLDKDNHVIIHLADDAAWREEVVKSDLRTKPNHWMPGKFTHPHDACFDNAGNIYVAEFVSTGRISKLKHSS